MRISKGKVFLLMLSTENRDFYEDQLELITSIEDILLPKTDESNDHQTDTQRRQSRNIKILTRVTLLTNIVSFPCFFEVFFLNIRLKILLIIKIIAAVISRSLSVISSVVDSTVDLLTSVILLWTSRKIKNRDAYKYPGGRYA